MTIRKGLINSVKMAGHHVYGDKLVGVYEFNGAEALKNRGDSVEEQLRTITSDLQQILEIAEKHGYEDIKKILEEKEYECGIKNEN